MSQRGMKKWAPFKSLNEQENVLNDIIKKHHTEIDISLSDEQIENINYILVNYNNELISLTFYKDGFNVIKGTISKININDKYLIINKKRIPFSLIRDIKKID